MEQCDIKHLVVMRFWEKINNKIDNHAFRGRRCIFFFSYSLFFFSVKLTMKISFHDWIQLAIKTVKLRCEKSQSTISNCKDVARQFSHRHTHSLHFHYSFSLFLSLVLLFVLLNSSSLSLLVFCLLVCSFAVCVFRIKLHENE